MSGFIEGESRSQATLFPERIDDYIAEENAVRVVDVFVDELDLSGLGFKTLPEATGRPAYHPAMMLNLYIYGYLSRIQSSRRLEREARRNVELMWLLGTVDFKTIADFRKNNGQAIRLVCREFVMLCRKLNLFSDAFVAIYGSKFRAVNNRLFYMFKCITMRIEPKTATLLMLQWHTVQLLLLCFVITSDGSHPSRITDNLSSPNV